jgi:hypothetical protein
MSCSNRRNLFMPLIMLFGSYKLLASRCRAYFFSADKISFHAWPSWSVHRAMCSHCQRELTGTSSEVGDVAHPTDIYIWHRSGQPKGRPVTTSVTSCLITYRFLIVLDTRLRVPGCITLIPILQFGVTRWCTWLRHKPEGRGFDSRWCHCNYSMT